jgi:hypothetical protein
MVETAYNAVGGGEAEVFGFGSPVVEESGVGMEGDGAADAHPSIGTDGGYFGVGVVAELTVDFFPPAGVEAELAVDVAGEVHGAYFGLPVVGGGEVVLPAGVKKFYNPIHCIFVFFVTATKVAGFRRAADFIITAILFIIGIVVSLLKFFTNFEEDYDGK